MLFPSCIPPPPGSFCGVLVAYLHENTLWGFLLLCPAYRCIKTLYMPWEMLMLGDVFRIHAGFDFSESAQTLRLQSTIETEKKTCLKWQLPQYLIKFKRASSQPQWRASLLSLMPVLVTVSPFRAVLRRWPCYMAQAAESCHCLTTALDVAPHSQFTQHFLGRHVGKAFRKT